MEFTTQKRREITSSILEQSDMIDQTKKFSNNINAGYGVQVEKDKTNRELYRTINSRLTGLAYEYKYMTGKYHPQLEEIEYSYIKGNDNSTEFVTEIYYDSPKLHSAGKLEEGNEFHLNLREDTSIYYPEHPLKYSQWTNDEHTDVTIFSPTEEDIFQSIRLLYTWYSSGGSSGDSELTIYGELKEYIPGEKDMNQPYMTVGYGEYMTGDGVFMDDGYNPVGDIILINGTDSNNYSFGKVISSKTEPSRILYAPYVIEGDIPNNSPLSSTYTSENNMYPIIIEKLLDRLNEIYKDILTYLSNNPEGISSDNIVVVNDLFSISSMITLYKEENSTNLSRILEILGEIEIKREGNRETRINYINSILSSSEELYEDRFKIIDMRLSKRMGTLREMMKAEGNVGEIFRISDEKQGQIDWLKKYFIVKRCESDGDYKRRVFIVDSEGDFEVGDRVYLLSNNEDVAEIYATIDIIIEARLEDILLSSYDESTGEIEKAYYPVKKIFFKDAWKEDEIKLKRYFPPIYKKTEGFRMIKQIS